MPDLILRPSQARLGETVLNLISRGERSAVAHLHPASGKTLAALHTANLLYQRGLIDTVQVFVPRLNLCSQFELDWAGIQDRFPRPRMGPITARDNTPPLLRDGQFGYVTTYGSLLAAQDSVAGNIHLDHARRRRSLAVFDEAQQLMVDEDAGRSSRSAEIAQRLSERAVFTLVLTGTPYRADGRPVLLARYGEPDAQGTRQLLADVEARYTEGVALGYLRPVEFSLVGGSALYERADAARERTAIAELTSGLRRVLEFPAYWQQLVDRTVIQVRRVQRLDPRLCGLIAASSQAHARAIARYLAGRYPRVRILVAVSDDARARDNLSAFRAGGYDLLITVQMAYIGFDHPPITVVCALTDFRQPGYLRQLFARGMRMLRGLAPERQMLYVIVPDDPPMAAFVMMLRQEVDQGLRERAASAAAAASPGSGGEPRSGILVAVEITGTRAQGLREGGDLDQTELPVLEQARERWRLGAAPATGLAELVRAAGGSIAQLEAATPSSGSPDPTAPPSPTAAAPDPPAPPPLEPLPARPPTQREREWTLRRRLSRQAVALDGRLKTLFPTWEFGESLRRCKRQFGNLPVRACGVGELEARLSWLETEWTAQVRRWERGR